MQRFEILEYMAAGCFQVEHGSPGLAIGVAFHGFTDGRMCDGCPKFNKGQCPSYKELTRGLAQNDPHGQCGRWVGAVCGMR